jgi:hypothetical protein
LADPSRGSQQHGLQFLNRFRRHFLHCLFQNCPGYFDRISVG